MGTRIRAVRVHRYAGTDENGKPVATPDPLSQVMSLDNIDAPQCRDGHVLISANYVGVQYPDALQAQGLYQERPTLPYTPGIDVTGTILEVGAGVDHLAAGDRVIAETGIGAMAETVCVNALSAWKAPQNVHLSKCANIGRNYFPAYHSLTTIGEVGPGDLVLVDGASGGVGMATIELARAMGAQVIAGVGSPEKETLPATAGADKVLCYGRDRHSYKTFKVAVKEAAAELGHPHGVDVVVDMVQGELFETLISTVRPLGKICMVGFSAGQKPIRPGMLLIKQAAAVGSLWKSWARIFPQQYQQNVSEIIGFLADGAITPRVDRIYPFDSFLDAFQLFENNEGRGNTVVCIREEAD
jgi:NADPH:quinone reductase-like Zn-dependent oxidoreductase